MAALEGCAGMNAYVTTSIDLELRGERVLHIETGFDEQLLKQIIVAVETTP